MNQRFKPSSSSDGRGLGLRKSRIFGKLNWTGCSKVLPLFFVHINFSDEQLTTFFRLVMPSMRAECVNRTWVTALWAIISLAVPLSAFFCFVKIQKEELTVAIAFTVCLHQLLETLIDPLL